jgi:hypothetical protein
MARGIKMANNQNITTESWLLLMHQLPPKADSFRVKIWRNLQKIGALQIKNSVYVLPVTAENQERFEKVVHEINAGKGDAFLCQTRFVQGIENNEIIAKFTQDRTEKYKALAQHFRKILHAHPSSDLSEEELMDIEHSFGKVERQLQELQAIDFFGSKESSATLKLYRTVLDTLNKLRKGHQEEHIRSFDLKQYQSKVWVTRSNIHVDRLASAWLINQFIDKRPKFKFVKNHNYKPTKNEIRFDMFNGEFTHIGDRCTFEILVQSFSLKKTGLSIIAEIIHDLDLKDTKFNRPETAGIGLIIESIVTSENDDFRRIKKANGLFDDLYRNIADRPL